MKSAYPLEAARELRGQELDEAARALGDASRRVDAARRNVASAVAAIEAHDVARAAQRAAENARGARSADDLLRGLAYEERLDRERQELVTKSAEAEEALAAARTNEESARSALADARAAKEAVERHYEAWLAERRRVAEKKAEDEAEDVALSRPAK